MALCSLVLSSSATIEDTLIKDSAAALAWMLSYPILLTHGSCWSSSQLQTQALITSTSPSTTGSGRMLRPWERRPGRARCIL